MARLPGPLAGAGLPGLILASGEQEGEPITPTRKVKRDIMYERFKSLVEDMYDDREQRLIAESAVEVL